MFKEYWFICTEIWQGKSVLRAHLNLRLKQETLRGKTIDIGGGKNASYISFMQQESDVSFETFDIKAGDNHINFETDKLPAKNGQYDRVLFLNVMEHIFNYQHIANEVVRITKPGGKLIGFVPFLMWYHPDHSDYFRYTHEALEKIFTEAGATEIKIEALGGGPFVAAAQMMILSIPFRWLRVLLFAKFYILDVLYKKIKKGNAKSYALGYYFVVQK
jgi:SAM-dependent methyltransferase